MPPPFIRNLPEFRGDVEVISQNVTIHFAGDALEVNRTITGIAEAWSEMDRLLKETTLRPDPERDSFVWLSEWWNNKSKQPTLTFGNDAYYIRFIAQRADLLMRGIQEHLVAIGHTDKDVVQAFQHLPTEVQWQWRDRVLYQLKNALDEYNANFRAKIQSWANYTVPFIVDEIQPGVIEVIESGVRAPIDEVITTTAAAMSERKFGDATFRIASADLLTWPLTQGQADSLRNKTEAFVDTYFQNGTSMSEQVVIDAFKTSGMSTLSLAEARSITTLQKIFLLIPRANPAFPSPVDDVTRGGFSPLPVPVPAPPPPLPQPPPPPYVRPKPPVSDMGRTYQTLATFMLLPEVVFRRIGGPVIRGGARLLLPYRQAARVAGWTRMIESVHFTRWFAMNRVALFSPFVWSMTQDMGDYVGWISYTSMYGLLHWWFDYLRQRELDDAEDMIAMMHLYGWQVNTGRLTYSNFIRLFYRMQLRWSGEEKNRALQFLRRSGRERTGDTGVLRFAATTGLRLLTSVVGVSIGMQYPSVGSIGAVTNARHNTTTGTSLNVATIVNSGLDFLKDNILGRENWVTVFSDNLPYGMQTISVLAVVSVLYQRYWNRKSWLNSAKTPIFATAGYLMSPLFWTFAIHFLLSAHRLAVFVMEAFVGDTGTIVDLLRGGTPNAPARTAADVEEEVRRTAPEAPPAPAPSFPVVKERDRYPGRRGPWRELIAFGNQFGQGEGKGGVAQRGWRPSDAAEWRKLVDYAMVS